YERIAAAIGEPTLTDIHYWHVRLADTAASYRTVSELLLAVCAPNVLHIGDVEFSNPRRPIAPARRTRSMTFYKGLGLFGSLVDRCVEFAEEKGLDAICLTPAAHDLVPLFESAGFEKDENEYADQIRDAGMAGPMSLRVPPND